MDKPLEGGCACGEVRYRLASAPMFTHCCHCTDCQRQTGAGFAVNALIERDRVELTKGQTVETNLPTDSGRPHLVHRCAACGVTLWSHYGGRRAVAFLRAGTLDHAAAIEPDVHIFTRSKLPWVRLPEGA